MESTYPAEKVLHLRQRERSSLLQARKKTNNNNNNNTNTTNWTMSRNLILTIVLYTSAAVGVTAKGTFPSTPDNAGQSLPANDISTTPHFTNEDSETKITKSPFSDDGEYRPGSHHKHHISRRSFDTLGSWSGMDQNFVGARHTRSPELSSLQLYKRLARFLNRLYINDNDNDGYDDMRQTPTKRQLESLTLSGDFGGMNQNFLSYPMSHRPQRKYYAWDQRSKRESFPNSKTANENLKDDTSMEFGFGSGYHPESPRSTNNHLTTSKRHFDDLSSGGFGNMGQNYVGKRSFDSLQSGDFGSFGQNFVNKKSSSSRVQPKRFDSLSSGSFGNLGQNFIARKRFGTLARSGLSGFNQNYVGKRPILFDAVSRKGYPYKRHSDSSSDEAWDKYSTDQIQSLFDDVVPTGATLPGKYIYSKRDIDGVGGWDGFSDMGQNYVNKRSSNIPLKRFDFLTSGSFGGLNQNYMSKKSVAPVESRYFSLGDLKRNYAEKRGFDSLQSGKFGGFGQNFINKKSTSSGVQNKRFESLSSGSFGNLGQNFLAGKRFGSLARSGLSGFNQNYVGKRSIDGLDSRGYSDMSQNFKTKRGSINPPKRFDSLSSGAFGGLNQNYISKRFFDSLASGGFSNMGQNFITKRSTENVRSKRGVSLLNSGYVEGRQHNFITKRSTDNIPFKRFSSLGSASFGGLGQNFVSKKRFDHLPSGAFSGVGQNDVHKRAKDINSKRFGSLASSSFGGFGQNYLSHKRFDPSFGGSSAFSGMNQNFVHKKSSENPDKRFNSFGGSAAFSGMNQNFVHKKSSENPDKRFNSFGGSAAFSGMNQNFVHKKSSENPDKRFNSFGGSAAFSVMNQNFVHKKSSENPDKRFNSFGGSAAFSGMNQNFVHKKSSENPDKRFDSLSMGSFGGLGQNYLTKRHFGSLTSSDMGGMGQNFVGKRFGSLGSGSFGGFSQNFVGSKRFGSLASGGSFSGMGQNFVSKKSTAAGAGDNEESISDFRSRGDNGALPADKLRFKLFETDSKLKESMSKRSPEIPMLEGYKTEKDISDLSQKRLNASPNENTDSVNVSSTSSTIEHLASVG